ncbi:MAG: sulfatase, partial [Rikenellaceae bacterium]
GMHDNIGKNVIYEESMRIPIFIYSKELEPRFDDELLYSLEDFYPTVMGLMGYSDLVPGSVQSRDLSSQIGGSRLDMPESQLYMLYSQVDQTGRNVDCGARGLRDLRYSYVVKYDKGVVTCEELYDRQEDPSQLDNIVDRDLAVKARLRKQLYQRLSEIDDPALDIIGGLL